MQASGYFDDDGNELNLDLYPKHQLCHSGKEQRDPERKSCATSPVWTRWTRMNSNVTPMKRLTMGSSIFSIPKIILYL